MKKITLFTTIALSSLFFFGCEQNKVNYTGCWLGEENMAFEVLTENGSDYIIRNVNGDLKASIQNGALRGKNVLDMEYKMSVKGDSAYYEFGGIVTGYTRISKEEYEKVVASLQKTLEVEEQTPTEAPAVETSTAETATEAPATETPAAEAPATAAPTESQQVPQRKIQLQQIVE